MEVRKVINIKEIDRREEILDENWSPVNWYEEGRFYGEENGKWHSVVYQFLGTKDLSYKIVS